MIWKEVPGWPFQVNELGFIRGPSGRILCPMQSKSGHLYVLYREGGRNGTQKKLFVHRAVLLAFVGPCSEGQEARHLNGDAQDNRLSNICWDTRKANMGDKKTHGTQSFGEDHPSAKLTETQVKEIKKRVSKETLRALASEFGVSHTAIRRAANGAKWRHLVE